MNHFSYSGDRHSGGTDALIAGLFCVAAGAAAYYAVSHWPFGRSDGQRRDDAPEVARRHGSGRAWRESALVGRTVTINRPRSELYAFWRDLKNLPQFMEDVHSIDVLDDKRSRWTVAGPGGAEVEFVSRITEERPDELIAWESEEGSSVRNSGRLTFRDAPGNRGTEVEIELAYDPPAGTAGRMVAKMMQREPNVQARRELKRFKQLMEAGEIATAMPGPAAPRA